MCVDGRRFVLVALLFVAVLGVVASTLWAWFWAGFTLDSGPLPRQLHLDEAVAAGLGAGLLVLALVPIRLLRAPRWLVVLVIAVVAILTFACVHQLLVAAGAPVRHSEDDAGTITIEQFCYAPTTWPMLLFVVVTPVVRARSLLGRRSAQDR